MSVLLECASLECPSARGSPLGLTVSGLSEHSCALGHSSLYTRTAPRRSVCVSARARVRACVRPRARARVGWPRQRCLGSIGASSAVALQALEGPGLASERPREPLQRATRPDIAAQAESQQAMRPSAGMLDEVCPPVTFGLHVCHMLWRPRQAPRADVGHTTISVTGLSQLGYVSVTLFGGLVGLLMPDAPT